MPIYKGAGFQSTNPFPLLSTSGGDGNRVVVVAALTAGMVICLVWQQGGQWRREKEGLDQGTQDYYGFL